VSLILANAIQARFPEGLDYEEARQLCLRLHTTANILPSRHHDTAGDKQELAETFARLARTRFIQAPEPHVKIHQGAHTNAPQTTQHWMEIIMTIYTGQDITNCHIPLKFQDIFPSKKATDSPNFSPFP